MRVVIMQILDPQDCCFGQTVTSIRTQVCTIEKRQQNLKPKSAHSADQGNSTVLWSHLPTNMITPHIQFKMDDTGGKGMSRPNIHQRQAQYTPTAATTPATKSALCPRSFVPDHQALNSTDVTATWFASQSEADT